jgi:transketolase
MNKETKSTRQGYGEALSELKNSKVVVLTGDLTSSTCTGKFENKYPDRFFQCGVAEQNMVAMATGFALEGKIPFVSSFAAFIPNRALDQIRVSVCYNNLPVKLASTHAGLTVGEDGATHQALEDIAIMRALPNMAIVVPCDANEASKATIQASKTKEPVYLRLGREKTPLITSKRTPFHIGRAEIFHKGTDVTIIACGVMVNEALKAVPELLHEGISAEVINCHTIKPLDEEKLLTSIKKTACVVTAEEHQKYGGLGSAISELVVKNNPVPIEMVAVNDTFGESGKANELLKKYGLTTEAIVKATKKVVKRKK